MPKSFSIQPLTELPLHTPQSSNSPLPLHIPAQSYSFPAQSHLPFVNGGLSPSA